MPDASGYDIFIWGGAETVVKGGKHLAAQNEELERIMNEFSREVANEKVLFDRAVDQMAAQERKSCQISGEASEIANSKIGEASSAVGEEKRKWESADGSARSALEQAQSLKRDLESRIDKKKREVDSLNSDLRSATSTRDSAMSGMQFRQQTLANARKNPQSTPSDLENCRHDVDVWRQDVQRANQEIRRIQTQKRWAEQVLARFRSFSGQVDAQIAAAQALVGRAKAGMGVVKQHEAKLGQLCNKSKENARKAGEAHSIDCKQLSAIRQDRKISDKRLDSLQADALSCQKETADTLDQECDTLQTVAERMALYEEFSFE